MVSGTKQLKFAGLVVAVGLMFPTVAPVDAADRDAPIALKARAVSTMNISRASSDRLDIEISRWSTPEERADLVGILETQGNRALADALKDRPETGWVRFDPRGGRGPGRDPRPSTLRYAWEMTKDGVREITLVTNHYIGYGKDPLAADGAKLANFPVSFVLLKLRQDDDGDWKGVGRMFVGAKLRYDSVVGNLVIDEFPMDPVYLKDVTIK